MYRIGNQQFPTYEDAQAWVDQGNVGGCYEIVPLSWCESCREWRDTETKDIGIKVCLKCNEQIESE